MQENKENLRSYSNTNSLSRDCLKIDQSSSKTIYRDINNSTLFDESSSWCHQSNSTFETIERMCNKSLSDPNNTIHEYLANFEKNKNPSDEEIDTMNQLFANCVININDSKFGNQTQLNEVEPPSCLWENTINNESGIQISPIKMIGQIRPSTILEESASDSMTSTNSYKSAQHLEPISSDQYETANESNPQSGCTEVPQPSEISCRSKAEQETIELVDSDNSGTSKSSASAYFDLFPLRKKPFFDFDNSSEPRLYHKTIFLADTTKASSRQYDVSTIDLSSRSSNTSDGISSLSIDSLDKSELRSSDLGEDSLEISRNIGNQYSDKSKTSFGYKKRSSVARKSLNESSKLNNNSMISISDDDSGTIESDDLNKGFVDESYETRDEESFKSSSFSANDLNVSRDFNDTLEEIEYIMKQGIKYLTDNKNPAQLKQEGTPKLQKTPTSMASPKTPCTVISKPKPALTSSQKKTPALQPSALFGFRDKNMAHFDHIVSPVRSYIRNTPISPITTLIKPSKSIFESKMARESRPCPTAIQTLETDRKRLPTSLPRKAYISAQYKHVIDQRSPIYIPGGNKIHRYLEPSMAAAVLRHEGKFKTDMMHRNENDVVASNEGTLADFSLASGDTSVLLLRDAKDLAGK